MLKKVLTTFGKVKSIERSKRQKKNYSFVSFALLKSKPESSLVLQFFRLGNSELYGCRHLGTNHDSFIGRFKLVCRVRK